MNILKICTAEEWRKIIISFNFSLFAGESEANSLTQLEQHLSPQLISHSPLEMLNEEGLPFPGEDLRKNGITTAESV